MFMPAPSPLSSSSSSLSFTKCKSSSPPTFGGFSCGWISYYRINYEEIKKLGRGAGGDAFLCRNNIDEDLYAIKKIRTKVSEAARLKEEAVILRHLDHPNIVRYYQVCSFFHITRKHHLLTTHIVVDRGYHSSE
jgi:serine/threonine protein kinase